MIIIVYFGGPNDLAARRLTTTTTILGPEDRENWEIAEFSVLVLLRPQMGGFRKTANSREQFRVRNEQ